MRVIDLQRHWSTVLLTRLCFSSATSTSALAEMRRCIENHIRLRTYILPGFFFFFRRLISELAERNLTKIGHMLGSKCDLQTHVQNLGYPLLCTNRNPKNHLFGRLRNLTETLTAYIFGTKRNIDNRSSARVSYIVPKCHELWSTNGFKLDQHFIPVSYTHLTLPTNREV